METKLYMSNSEVALDFDCESDRDAFYLNLAANPTGGFSPQCAADKVGARTIRFRQSDFRVGYSWPVIFPEQRSEIKRPTILTWDWKEQPPWVEVEAAVQKYKNPRLVEVRTGCDDYAIVICSSDMTQEEAVAYYEEHRFDSDED